MSSRDLFLFLSDYLFRRLMPFFQGKSMVGVGGQGSWSFPVFGFPGLFRRPSFPQETLPWSGVSDVCGDDPGRRTPSRPNNETRFPPTLADTQTDEKPYFPTPAPVQILC